MRQYDSLLRVRPYRKMREFEAFSEVAFSEKGAPIENLELAHFGYPLHKVSLDIVTKKEFIPGTSQLKESYMNKVRSLKNIGWKHLVFSEEQLRDKSLADVVSNIQTCFEPYIEEQQAIIDYEDYQVAETIELHKKFEEMKEWDLDDINSFMNKIQGLEDIQLGEDGMDPIDKEISEDPHLRKAIARNREEDEQEKKKKK